MFVRFSDEQTVTSTLVAVSLAALIVAQTGCTFSRPVVVYTSPSTNLRPVSESTVAIAILYSPTLVYIFYRLVAALHK